MSIPLPIIIPFEFKETKREKQNEMTKFSWDFAVEDSYQKLSKIARGSKSTIFSAFHIIHGYVVVKEYKDIDIEYAEYESEMLKVSKDSAPTVYDTWVSRNGTFNIAMEGVSCTLYECMVYLGMKTDEKIVFIKNLFRALRDLHKKVIHFDLKPSHIGILQKFGCKLLDFGLSEHFNVETNETKMSPFYRPPECFYQMPMSEKSDLWSLGCILWDIASENPDDPLFKDIDSDSSLCVESILKKGVERIKLEKSPFMQKMYDTISKCLKYNQDERPSAQELMDDWADFRCLN